MPPWWKFLSWYKIFQSSHYNSCGDRTPVGFTCGPSPNELQRLEYITGSHEPQECLPIGMHHCLIANWQEKIIYDNITDAREITQFYICAQKEFDRVKHMCMYDTGPLFRKKKPSYGYKNPHYKPKMVWRQYQLHNGNPYTNKVMSSFMP